jgi:6-phosphogluconolactonase
VPPDDERSNYRLVRETILDRLGEPGPDVRRIRGEDGADAAAGAYEAELREAFGGGLPEIDLMLLGIGPDGHTASLFPGTPALEVTDRLVVAVPKAGQPPHVPRVTVTLPVLNKSREVIFLIAGADKAPVVARAFGGDPDPSLPAAMVSPASGRLTLILDPAAAAEL